jgi:hypothetical protein
MRRLLTHLAQFSSFSKQGEFLCTQGLVYLLENPDAQSAFTAFLLKTLGSSFTDVATREGIRISVPLTWRAEVRQQDAGRPDLQACNAAGKPVIKIEAKLSAAFGHGQLRSYLADFQRHCCSGLLLVLVPRRRAEEISVSTAKALERDGAGPWRVGENPDCSVAVTLWEDVLDALSTVSHEPFASDLAQFQAMYRVLNGYDIEPPATEAELLAWRDREEVYVSLVDRVTRRLTPADNVMPMATDSQGYRRRYVCRPVGTEYSCFSVGVRDPFAGNRTPIWLRFNRGTAMFSVIHAQLTSSSLSHRLVESGGHVWIPLDVPLDATDGDELVESLVAQAKTIVDVAYQSLP